MLIFPLKKQWYKKIKSGEKKIESYSTKEHFSYDGRFHTYNLREIFK